MFIIFCLVIVFKLDIWLILFLVFWVILMILFNVFLLCIVIWFLDVFIDVINSDDGDVDCKIFKVDWILFGFMWFFLISKIEDCVNEFIVLWIFFVDILVLVVIVLIGNLLLKLKCVLCVLLYNINMLCVCVIFIIFFKLEVMLK